MLLGFEMSRKIIKGKLHTFEPKRNENEVRFFNRRSLVRKSIFTVMAFGKVRSEKGRDVDLLAPTSTVYDILGYH